MVEILGGSRLENPCTGGMAVAMEIPARGAPVVVAAPGRPKVDEAAIPAAIGTSAAVPPLITAGIFAS
jgi:hypothetical protein